MSVANFIPEIMAAGILKERDEVMVAVKNCNKNWEGQIKQKGDRVKIRSVGDVTIKTYTRNADIDAPEIPSDMAQYLDITEEEYFNIAIDNVDNVQADEDLLAELKRKAGIGLANNQDLFIFNKYTQAGTTLTQGALTSANMFSTLTKALRIMQRVGKVPEGTKKVLEVSPEVAEKMILAKIIKDTNNSDIIKNGKVGNFFGLDIFVSTNVINSGSDDTVRSYCLLRTLDAITFAEQFTKMQAYEPQARFSDAMKGIQVYGAQVVRPKELICLDLTCAAETAV